jgi:type IV pilus assembly protein PilM
MARTFVGIDLGSRNVRYVAGTLKGTVFTLTKVSQAEVRLSDDPESAILAALPELAEELGDKARKASKGARFGLSGKELIIRYTQVPPVPTWRLRLLMDFEVREMAAQAGDTLASDYNLVTLPNAGDAEDTVLVAVCKESFLKARFDAVRSALGDPGSAMPASLALFNAFVGSGDIHDGEYTFLVDLGDRNVELALQKDGELLFARNIATGGRALTESIAQALGTSLEDAEGLKHQFGSVTPRGLATYTSGREEKVGNAIIGPVGQLSAMIQSSLAFIRAQTKIRDLELGRILLSGGGANLRGLPEYLGAAFHCPVGRFQPEAGLDLTQLPADEAALFQTDPGSFAVALGLARTGADPQAFKLELVPQPVTKKRRFAERTLFLILSGVAALAFLVLTFVRESKVVGDLEKTALAEKNAAEGARSRRKLYDAEQAKIADLNGKMAHVAAYTEPAAALLRVQALVQQNRPENVWIESITVKREAVPDPAKPNARVQQTRVRVVGKAMPGDAQPEEILKTLKLGIERDRKGTEVQIVKQTPVTRGGPIDFEMLVELKDAS